MIKLVSVSGATDAGADQCGTDLCFGSAGHTSTGRGMTPWRTRSALPAVGFLDDTERQAKESTRERGDVSGSADQAGQRCAKNAR